MAPQKHLTRIYLRDYDQLSEEMRFFIDTIHRERGGYRERKFAVHGHTLLSSIEIASIERCSSVGRDASGLYMDCDLKSGCDARESVYKTVRGWKLRPSPIRNYKLRLEDGTRLRIRARNHDEAARIAKSINSSPVMVSGPVEQDKADDAELN